MEPLDQFAKFQPMIQLEIDNKLKAFSNSSQYDVAEVPSHVHNGTDSAAVDFSNINNRTRFILYRIVNAVTDVAVANVAGGDFVMPFNGYITEVGATVDTAGTTNVTTVDINKNGSSVLLTKITIDSGEKTSRTGATLAVVNTGTTTIQPTFIAGDIFTFDVDTVSTTAPKGLTVFINVTES